MIFIDSRPSRPFLATRDLKSITPRDLAMCQKPRLEQGRKPRTVNRELQTFSIIMNWAKNHHYIDDVPKTERIPIPPTRTFIPTPEEAVRIIKALPDRLQLLARFLFETGCRRGEAINLTWDYVDELGGYVEIQSRDGWTPKTAQSERRVPLDPSLLEMIRNLPKTSCYVFPGPHPAKPYTTFHRHFTAADYMAGIQRRGKPVRMTPQICRKAHANWQAERGINESVLQGLLGHASGSKITKQFYIHTTEEAKSAAVITLPFKNKTGS